MTIEKNNTACLHCLHLEELAEQVEKGSGDKGMVSTNRQGTVIQSLLLLRLTFALLAHHVLSICISVPLYLSTLPSEASVIKARTRGSLSLWREENEDEDEDEKNEEGGVYTHFLQG